MSLWWAGPCQGVCLVGSRVLRKTLSCLFVDGWGCVPTLLVVWPEASQHWSLQAVGRGQVLVRKWWPPKGHMPLSTPQNYSCQCLWLSSEPQPSPTSTGDAPIPAGRSGPGSHEAIAFFPWVLVHTGTVELLFPPVIWGSWDQTPWAFKARFSGGSSFCCQAPRLGSLMWGSELSLLWENLCDIIIFQFVGCPPGRYGI